GIAALRRARLDTFIGEWSEEAMNVRVLSTILPIAFLAACGGGKQEAESPDTAAADSTSASETEPQAAAASSGDDGPASGPWDIPGECHKGSDPCTPNPKWVKKLCEDVYPAVALYLFSKSSPFTHGY